MPATLSCAVRSCLIVFLAGLQPVSAQRGESDPGPPPAVVSGTVLGAEGMPFEGASVHLGPILDNHQAGLLRLEGHEEPEPVASAVTADDGRYRLAVPSPGAWSVTIEAKGHLPMTFRPLVVAGSRELPALRLAPSVPLAVRVLSETGEPRGRIWVVAEGETENDRLFDPAASGWRASFRLERTDPDGRVSFPRTDGKVLRIAAIPPDAAPVSLTAEEAAVLRIETSSTIYRTVRAVDGEGRPVRGVLVRHGKLLWPAGVTDAEGRAKVPFCDCDDDRLLLVARDGRRVEAPLEVATGPGTGERETLLRLPRRLRLTGKLVDASSGRPVPGAVVWPIVDPGRFTATDADGGYQAVASSQEILALQTSAPGYVARQVAVDPRRLSHGRLPSVGLQRSSGLRGRVVDPAGDPVPGAAVAAFLRRPDGSRRPFLDPDPADSRGITTPDGSFQVAGLLPAAPYEIEATAPGFTSARVEGRSPRPDDRGVPLRVILEAGRAVLGRVLDAEDRPIQGASVSLRRHGADPRREETGTGDHDPFTAETEADGRFRVQRLPAPEIDVEVRAAGFPLMRVRRVRMPPGTGPAQLGTFRLVPGTQIHGRVVDPEGEPVAGATVHAFDEDLSEWPKARLERPYGEPAAVTDQDGLFRAGDFEPGAIRDLLIRAEGYLPAIVAGVRAPPAEPPLVSLEPAALLAGRVVDATAQGVADARVYLSLRELLAGADRPTAVGRPFERSSTTDKEGRFTFAGIDHGAGLLSVEAAGFVLPDPVPLQIEAAQHLEGLEIVVERGAEVSGQVLTADGEPVAGARVTVESAGGFTDAEGLYHLQGVPLGEGSARVSHRHYRRQTREVEIVPGANVLDWTLPTGQEVSGRVTTAEGEPAPGALVRLATEEKHDGRELWAVSGSGGDFRFDEVPRDEYHLSAESEEYGRARLERPVRVGDEPLDPFDLVLRPTAVVEGRVLGLEFDEIGQVRVEAERTGTGDLAHGSVDWQGAYEIRGLFEGDWRVTASLDRARRRVEARVPVGPGTERVSRDLEFTDGPTLTGTVLYHGNPLSSAAVSVRGLQSSLERTVRTDYEGRFQIENLDAGPYWLGVRHDMERVTYNGSVEISSDRELVLDVSAGNLRGRVRDGATGEPVAEALVSVKRADGLPGAEGLIAGPTDRSGKFSLERLPAGPYALSVSKSGYAPIHQGIEVYAGDGANDSLELSLEPTAGLAVQIVTPGTAPPYVEVLVADGSGRLVVSEARTVEGDGLLHLPSVPEGRWRLYLQGPGFSLVQQPVTVPGEGPAVVPMQPAALLDVELPELRESNQRATLQVFGPDGSPLQVIDLTVGLRSSWPLTAGRTTLEGLPPGVWTLLAQTADGRSWSATVTSTGGGTLEAQLH